MLNPDAEINRLRHNLRFKDYPEDLVDAMCDAASADINEFMLDVVSSALVDVAEHAYEMELEELAADLDVVDVGGIFQIITRSRKTDYSTPEIHMLPNLLKNAETAGDGSRYKIIPIHGKGERRRMGKNMFEDQQQRQKALEAARQSLKAGRATSTGTMLQSFREMMHRNVAARKQFYELPSVDGTPNFKTASSNQDPSTSWVVPAQDKDMTGYIMQVNDSISRNVQDAVVQIVAGYEGD